MLAVHHEEKENEDESVDGASVGRCNKDVGRGVNPFFLV